MKKRFFSSVLLCLFLVSCSADSPRAEDILARYENAKGIDITADVTAEFSDRADTYRVHYKYLKDSDCSVEVIEPQSIAGIAATISEKGTVLEFDGAILETGVSNTEKIMPLNATDKLIRKLALGNVSEVGREGENCLLVFRDENIEYRAVMTESGDPISAEILNHGRLILSIDFIKCEVTN